MNFECINDLVKDLSNKFNAAESDINISLEICPANMEGDFTVNCFRLTKVLKQKPDSIADAVLSFLNKHNDVESANKIKAFVNFGLKSGVLYNNTLANVKTLLKNATLPDSAKHKILIEYSAPNTNKPLHLGHLRNNTLGMALCSLLERVGNEVFGVNLINDRGIHICKSMIGYQRFGNDETPETANKKGDHFVGDFYVLFDKELKRQIEELKKSNPELSEKTDEELFPETEIGKAAQATLIKWENGDPEVIALWKKMNKWVLDGFSETYKRMGIDFTRVYLESDTYKLGKDIVLDGYKKGIFQKREDGAIYADLKPFKLTEKVLLRPDATSVYITQDIGTTLMKYRDFHPDTQIWVVGDEQIHHFKTLFALVKVLNYECSENLHHLAYGMVNLPSGKMKSREGKVVDADNLFDDMQEFAKNATLERCGDNVPEDIDDRSEIIALGALKFMLLKFNPKTTIMFDPEASIKFEGDTGPYVQYVCARINSILSKAKAKHGDSILDFSEINWSLLDSKWERKLAILSAFYSNNLIAAAEKLDCSVLIGFLLNLAKAYNSFYRECPVLAAGNEELIKARLALSSAVKDILADGLKTLTIRIPKAM
ncbi:MAG TPA: arginine--tRNA ligase [Victivallales bacterium]|nr:arginine--tRNA ligase [Victivallales bacterium]